MKKIQLLLAAIIVVFASCEQKSNIDLPLGLPEGVESIDLGLSVKWATMNVGATRPEEFGAHFAWGETSTKKLYHWMTYKWCNGTVTTMTKYCIKNEYGDYGVVDNRTELEDVDDAATVNWGDDWRMPTTEEWQELRSECTWIWTTINRVKGYKVTAPNGNSIFLPAAGSYWEDGYIQAGGRGDYWSSTLGPVFPQDAYGLGFYSEAIERSIDSRYVGRSIRPVYNK